MNVKIVRKIPAHYVQEDCVQEMSGYRNSLCIIDSTGILYNDFPNEEIINRYLEDERRTNFPYHNIPSHIRKFGFKKYSVINRILDFNKIYVHFTEQGIFTEQAIKDGEEALVVFEKMMYHETPVEEMLTREELENQFNERKDAYYFCKGRPYNKLIVPTDEQILEKFRREVENDLIIDARPRETTKDCIESLVKNISNSITIEQIPANYEFLAKDNNILIVTNTNGIIQVEIIDIRFMAENLFKLVRKRLPIKFYTYEDIKDEKVYESKEPEISLRINKK
jgi:hypothetical protein